MKFYPQVEMIFKTNMIGSAGRMPTIVSPEMYRERLLSLQYYFMNDLIYCILRIIFKI